VRIQSISLCKNRPRLEPQRAASARPGSRTSSVSRPINQRSASRNLAAQGLPPIHPEPPEIRICKTCLHHGASKNRPVFQRRGLNAVIDRTQGDEIPARAVGDLSAGVCRKGAEMKNVHIPTEHFEDVKIDPESISI
jgi:hypothetical protein